MQFMNDSKWVSPFDSLIPLLVVFLFLALTLPAHAETVQSYPNLPGAVPDNAFASAPLLDSTVVVPLIGETRLEIPAPTAEALASKAANQIGVAVEIPAEQRGLPGLAQDSAWTTVGEHRYARLTLRSVGAVSVRAGVAIPDGFPGRVLSVSGSGIVESELKRGDQLAWSSTSDGDTLTLLVEIPAGYRFHEGDLAVPVASHIDSDPLAADNGFANIFPATTICATDLACIKSNVQRTAAASVMKIVFTRKGNTYSCSGTLLADSARSYKPYVYTANHCIDSQTVADTVITYWNHQYSTCPYVGPVAVPDTIKLSKGVQLLDGSASNDHALLLLNESPPDSAIFLGWNSDPLASNTAIAFIGHPLGNMKKISFGSVRTPAFTRAVADNGTDISSAWDIDITDSALQSGNSGGALITCDGQSCHLRGGAMGMAYSLQTCPSSQRVTASRFDIAYQSLKRWLLRDPMAPSPTSLVFRNWPLTVAANTTIAAGTVAAIFSDGSKKSVVASFSSSVTNLLWLKNGAIITREEAVDTPVTVTAQATENGVTVTGTTTIIVKAVPLIKTAPLIVVGHLFSLGLGADGRVWGWGKNDDAVLGDKNTFWASTSPLKFPISSVIRLAAHSHVLALTSDGSVWGWGSNSGGQLAIGLGTSSSIPLRVREISGVSAVAAGGNFSVALKADGTVWSWGSNDAGQLGNGTSGSVVSIIPVQAKGIVNAKAIVAGARRVFALLSDGTVMGWGDNSAGQLGTATSGRCSYYYGYEIQCAKTPVKMPNLANVASIAAGGNHGLALISDGTVWAWGSNFNGQLGDGTETASSVPKPIPSLTNVVAIAAGAYHSLALRADGTVWAWGQSNSSQVSRYSQLGYPTNDLCNASVSKTPCSKSPGLVLALTNVSAISAGDFHNLALKTDGSVWAWGSGIWGELGTNTSTNSTTPVQVVGLGGQGLLDLGASQIPAAITDTAKTSDPLDCLFAWAEKTHPDLLAPGGGATGTLGAYRYRHYPATSAYLGLSSDNDHFYYLGPSTSNRLTDLGTASTWYATAGCR